MKKLATIFLFTLTSCMTEKNVRGYLERHPVAGARYCAEAYPVHSVYVQGRDSIRYEAVPVTIPGGMVSMFLPSIPPSHRVAQLSNADTARAGILTLTWQRVTGGYAIRCRADSLQLLLDSLKEIHKRTDTLVLENTAHVKALQADSARLKQKLHVASAQADKWKKWALYAFAGVAVLCGWTFRKQILGIIKR